MHGVQNCEADWREKLHNAQNAATEIQQGNDLRERENKTAELEGRSDQAKADLNLILNLQKTEHRLQQELYDFEKRLMEITGNDACANQSMPRELQYIPE